MRTRELLCAIGLAATAMTVAAQQGQPADPERTPGVQAGQDPKRAAFVAANCKTPAPAPEGRGGRPGGPGGGRAGGGAAGPGGPE
jgi:hypothetical protein